MKEKTMRQFEMIVGYGSEKRNWKYEPGDTDNPKCPRRKKWFGI